ERLGDKAAHEFRARADVNRGDGDSGVLTARILPHIERADRLKARDENHEIHHDGQHRPADENVSEGFHFRFPCRAVNQLSDGFGFLSVLGVMSSFTTTLWPLRSLNRPELTTFSPTFNPDSMLMKSPLARPTRTNCCRAPKPGGLFVEF